MFENARLKIRQALEWKTLQKHKDTELKVLRQKKQFEINKTDLEREAEIEELKANIRKEQNKSPTKNAQQTEKKSAFAAFQDYCDDFANQQSVVGDIKFGGVNGKNNKGSRKRNKSGTGTGFYRI